MAAASPAKLGAVLCGILSPLAWGLRTPSAGGNGCEERQPFRQTMTNDHDVQYHVEIKIGGQTVTGIMDTGSFELVVFSKSCSTCGTAAAYNELGSGSFEKGNMTHVHAYGSGKCKSKDGRDTVDIGCFSAPHQAMWLAMDCKMPVLEYASFNAIVGVGPPGQPEVSARKLLAQAKEMEDHAKETNTPLPEGLKEKKAEVQAMLEDALAKKDLLENLGSDSFSVCLGKEAGSDAFFVWNDADRREQQGVITFPVVGDMTWSVKVDSMSFHFADGKRVIVGCDKGCGTIVDTGTSLIGLPTNAYKRITDSLQHIGLMECSDLSRFPDLIITIDGHSLHFPPSAYLGMVTGELNQQMSQLMHRKATQAGQEGQPAMGMCELLLMDMGEQETDFGDLMILGMPFFREFYTTFHLGQSRSERSISVAPADAHCYPNLSPEAQTFQTARSSTATTPRVLDGSKLRAPHWLGSHEGPGL